MFNKKFSHYRQIIFIARPPPPCISQLRENKAYLSAPYQRFRKEKNMRRIYEHKSAAGAGSSGFDARDDVAEAAEWSS